MTPNDCQSAHENAWPDQKSFGAQVAAEPSLWE
jgi:hypothetical protein